MELRINTESAAARAIVALTHSAGTAEIYINTLSRLYNAALFCQDDLGMGDTEALDTLRALALLRSDIQDIAADKKLGRIIRHHMDHDEHDGQADTPTRDPWNTAMAALTLAADNLATIAPANTEERDDINELIGDIIEAAGRLTKSAARAAALKVTPDYKPTEYKHEVLASLFTSTAYYNAVGSSELLTDALDHVERSGIEGVADALKEATDAQRLAKEKIEHLAGLLKKARDNEEGGDE